MFFRAAAGVERRKSGRSMEMARNAPGMILRQKQCMLIVPVPASPAIVPAVACIAFFIITLATEPLPGYRVNVAFLKRNESCQSHPRLHHSDAAGAGS